MGKTAFIFPGQGAQYCGMGQDFYENSKTAKAVFDRATELLGFSMPELCFEKNDRLDITEYTQAAMVTVSVAMMKVMEEQGFRPDVAAGLSLGEYPALVAAGCHPHGQEARDSHAGGSSGGNRRHERRPGDDSRTDQ